MNPIDVIPTEHELVPEQHVVQPPFEVIPPIEWTSPEPVVGLQVALIIALLFRRRK